MTRTAALSGALLAALFVGDAAWAALLGVSEVAWSGAAPPKGAVESLALWVAVVAGAAGAGAWGGALLGRRDGPERRRWLHGATAVGGALALSCVALASVGDMVVAPRARPGAAIDGWMAAAWRMAVAGILGALMGGFLSRTHRK